MQGKEFGLLFNFFIVTFRKMSIFRSGLFKDKVAIVTGETPVI